MVIIMKRLGMFLLAAGCFAPAMAIDKIALPNGSFEELNAQKKWPANWKYKAQSKGEVITGGAADGEKFLRFAEDYGVLSYDLNVKNPANAEVEVSAAIKGSGNCKFGMILLYMIKTRHTVKPVLYTHRTIWDHAVSDKWQTVTGKVKLREEAVDGPLYVAYYRSNRTGVLDLDKVSVKTISTAAQPVAEPVPAAASAPAIKKAAAKPAVKLPALPSEIRTNLTPPGLHLMLPETVYTVPRFETNIFFENVVDTANINAYAIEVKCPVGKHYTNRWAWTPRPEDAGKTFELELRLINDHGLVISGKTRIFVAKEPADSKKPIRLALLGDSLLLCKYPEHLRDTMLKTGFVNYVPVGSYTPSGEIPKAGDMAHDAYGGFAWGDFLRRWKYSIHVVNGIQDKAEREQMIALGVINVPKSDDYRMRSPLLRLENGKPVLDVPMWLKRINNGKSPEFIIVELGGNDVFSATTPEQLDEYVNASMNNARTLLAELRKHAPESMIGVTTGQVGCSQDGFGYNYDCRQSSYQYRRNIQRYNREITKLLKELNDPAIELVPIHHCIDSVNSYIKQSRPVHKRSKLSKPIDVNALHPNLEGGYQVGDAIYAWLRKKLMP